ncbi:pyridoxine 5'-phosphate synthase, partial [Acinetobacter baumannii]
HQVELCTAAYAEATQPPAGFHPETQARIGHELDRLRRAAALAAGYGLRVAAGHGLTCRNVVAVASIPEIEEFNIGHNIIARAVLVGLDRAV